MPTKSLGQPRLRQLESEVSALRSFVIGIAGKDPEGSYRPEFVERVLRLSQEKPVGVFKDRHSFLKQLKMSG